VRKVAPFVRGEVRGHDRETNEGASSLRREIIPLVRWLYPEFDTARPFAGLATSRGDGLGATREKRIKTSIILHLCGEDWIKVKREKRTGMKEPGSVGSDTKDEVRKHWVKYSLSSFWSIKPEKEGG